MCKFLKFKRSKIFENKIFWEKRVVLGSRIKRFVGFEVDCRLFIYKVGNF